MTSSGTDHRSEPNPEANGSDATVPPGRRLPAVTPQEPRRPATLRPYDEIPGELGEAVRGIINRAEMRSGAPLPKSIAVTSPLSGEGVTTVSQSLATIIAQELGYFVCWVDCEWMRADRRREPDPHRPSMIDILEDRSRLLAAFESTPDLPQLVALSPGPVPEAKRNLIARAPEFERLLGVLNDEFDHVVFDVPPVLSSPNGLALLRQADAALFVVRQRSTTLSQVRQALAATQPTPTLAVVLNQFDTRMPSAIARLLGG